MQNFKLNTTNLPIYCDGQFSLYDIKQTADKFPIESIKDTSKKMCFEELSVSDRLRFEADQRDMKITLKIRIPQTKEITSLNVLKIGQEYHKVFNAYHFTNKDGFKQTDITLENYPNAKVEEIIWQKLN